MNQQYFSRSKPKAIRSYGDGFHRLADFMSWSTVIMPRFKSLNLLNLLLLQAEICDLEQALKDYVNLDEDPEFPERKSISIDWTVYDSLDSKDPRKQTMNQLREKLSTYNEALLQQIEFAEKPRPSQHSLDQLTTWMKHESGGKALRGPGSRTWLGVESGGRPLEDFVILGGSVQDRTLSRWLRTLTSPMLHLLPRKFVGIEEWKAPNSEEAVFTRYGTGRQWKSAGDKAVSFLAATIVLIPVIVLTFVNSANARLGIIVSFTLAFSLILSFTTEASRSESFAATAAFVAVQVVYVGSALSGNSNQGQTSLISNATSLNFT